jgi:outer membrane lipoprotein-sorting protein
VKKSIIFFLFIFVFQLVAAQESTGEAAADSMETAKKFRHEVEQKYNNIKDMKCAISIKINGDTLKGTLFFKRPNLLKIEFSSPRGQVISMNGTKLQIYIPSQNVSMEQELGGATADPNASAFSVLKSIYAFSFPEDIKNSYVPLDANNPNSMKVKKLVLKWIRRGQTSIKQMILCVNKENFIVRVEALSDQNQKIVMDMSNIKTNLDLPSSDFEYDSPPSAYVMPNFLSE